MANAVAHTTGENIEGCCIVFDPQGAGYCSEVSKGIIWGRESYPSFVSGYMAIFGRELCGRFCICGGEADQGNRGRKSNRISSRQKVGFRYCYSLHYGGEEKIMSIRFPKIMSPAEQGRGGDTRHLGLALVSLQIEDQERVDTRATTQR